MDQVNVLISNWCSLFIGKLMRSLTQVNCIVHKQYVWQLKAIVYISLWIQYCNSVTTGSCVLYNLVFSCPCIFLFFFLAKLIPYMCDSRFFRGGVFFFYHRVVASLPTLDKDSSSPVTPNQKNNLRIKSNFGLCFLGENPHLRASEGCSSWWELVKMDEWDRRLGSCSTAHLDFSFFFVKSLVARSCTQTRSVLIRSSECPTPSAPLGGIFFFTRARRRSSCANSPDHEKKENSCRGAPGS